MSFDNQTLQIGIVGYKGRMGRELLDVAEQRKILTITDDNKQKLFDLADIVIDFSSADGLRECLQEVKRTKKPLVSGSTPMNDELYKEMLEKYNSGYVREQEDKKKELSEDEFNQFVDKLGGKK